MSSASAPAARRASADMPAVSCSAVSSPAGSTPIRTTAVRMRASVAATRAGVRHERCHEHRTELRVAAWPGLTPRLLRTEPAPRTSPSTAAPAATGPSTIPTRSSTRSSRPVWSGAAVRRSRWRSSCARCATTVDSAATPSSSPMVKRANRLRSRTGGCCATVRTWSSTACGWPPASSVPGTRTSTSPTGVGARRRDRAGRARTETLDGLTVSVRTVEPGYVAGEETAAVRAINGGPAKPTDKPPRPFEEGVGGLPTLVSNVETLANLPYIHRHGAEAFRAAGHVGVAGNLPGDHHRRRATAGTLRGSFRAGVHRTA